LHHAWNEQTNELKIEGSPEFGSANAPSSTPRPARPLAVSPTDSARRVRCDSTPTATFGLLSMQFEAVNGNVMVGLFLFMEHLLTVTLERGGST
jgi:hypothetical protein